MENKSLIGMLIVLAIYLLLRFLGGSFGEVILYPITLFVTFLHEFGHAAGAIFTGGKVDFLQVNSDGSGVTGTIGGSRGVILMGGYIGSAIFGNLLFYIGAKHPKAAGIALGTLAVLMGISGLFWFETLFTTFFLIAFAAVVLVLARYTDWDRWIIMFLGLASIIHIIRDFNVGPTSDLAEYAKIFIFIPVTAWMYIWLVIVLLLCLMNLRLIFRGKLK